MSRIVFDYEKQIFCDGQRYQHHRTQALGYVGGDGLGTRLQHHIVNQAKLYWDDRCTVCCKPLMCTYE